MKKYTIFIFTILVFQFTNATDSTYVHYKGTYLFPYGSMIQSVDISVADTVLMINSSLGNSRLDKMGKDTFYLVAYDGIVIFKRDSLSNVKSIKIEAQAVLLEGDKQSEKKSGSASFYKKEDIAFIRESLFKMNS